MSKYDAIVIISLALVFYNVYFVIKNFLIKFIASDHGFLNVAIILLFVVSLCGALIAGCDALYAQNIIDYLASKKYIGDKELDYLQKELIRLSTQINISLITGYVAALLGLGGHQLIKREIKRANERPKRLWNWEKVTSKDNR